MSCSVVDRSPLRELTMPATHHVRFFPSTRPPTTNVPSFLPVTHRFVVNVMFLAS